MMAWWSWIHLKLCTFGAELFSELLQRRLERSDAQECFLQRVGGVLLQFNKALSCRGLRLVDRGCSLERVGVVVVVVVVLLLLVSGGGGGLYLGRGGASDLGRLFSLNSHLATT